MLKIDEKLRDDLDKILDELFDRDNVKETLLKKILDLYADIELDITYELQNRLKQNLSYFVVDMAENAVKSILEGNEARLRKYLSCDQNSRTSREGHNEVIHGKLFETEPIRLRKSIVDAYPELLKNERILDLEAQVESLVEQVKQANDRAEAIYERYR